MPDDQKSRVLLALTGTAGGAALALVAVRGGVLRSGCLLLVRVALLLYPVVSCVRLLRHGKRRAALQLAVAMAARRFCSRWWQYLTIPLFAGAVGWLTNKVAVDMIFSPLEFGGLRLKTYPNQPLGWVGWQGIVPAKAGVMAQRITDMVTGQLLNVRQVFGRLDPDHVSRLMAPGVDRIAEQVVVEMVPPGTSSAALGVGRAALRGLPADAQQELLELRHQFVSGLTRDMQQHIDELVDLNEVVVGGMVREKKLLVDLFQRCGSAELAFLVNSGFLFGCALGVLQMLFWLFYERAWTLALGGAVVGYLTNLIALKLIFEPVEPVRIGPFWLQGMFLKRQVEVSEEFADCMTEKLLSSETLWHNILTGSGAARFSELLQRRTATFMAGTAAVLYGGTAPTEFAGREYWAAFEGRVSSRVLELLPQELPLVHTYVDDALNLRSTLKENLRKLSPHQFEGLLHPVFQEDELTLVLVGSVLGLAVGYGQAVWDERSRAASDPDLAP